MKGLTESAENRRKSPPPAPSLMQLFGILDGQRNRAVHSRFAWQSGNGTAHLQVTNLAAAAVWEVTMENPAAIDTLVVNVYVILPAQSTQSLNIVQSLGPNPDSGVFTASAVAMAEDSTFSIPRFASPSGSNE